MAEFVKRKEKELVLCKMLLKVKSATKKVKGEEFNVDQGLIQSAEDTIEECKQLWAAFLTEPISGIDHLKRFVEKRRVVDKLITELKMQTNFFSSKMDEENVLIDLEIATAKFLEVAQ